MRRLVTSLVMLLLVGPSLANLSAAEKIEKPNIILILSDDVGIGNIESYGGAFNTPRLDELAKGGTQFTYCYAPPLCGPSRCQLLTGRYPFRTGLNSNQSRDAVDPKREVMIPTILKKAGYATCSVGKWGQICLGPGEWGFDEYLVYPGSGRFWRAQTAKYKVNGKEVNLPPNKYLPGIMHEFIVDFIKRHKDQPFFVYYPMSHMHAPIVRTPESKPGADADELYRENNAYMDKLVGQLMDELDTQHLREKTLVIFTGDNGTARMGVDLAKVDGKAISGQKASMPQEGGARVPLIVNWPGTTPAGKTNNDLTDFTDFFATFADLGSAELPENLKIDGHSFAPQIRGAKGTPREWVYVELNGKSYVRDDQFKLTGTGEMFDLSQAPFKEIPVASDSKDPKAIAARKALQTVLDDHKAAPFKQQTLNKQQRKQRAMRRKARQDAA